MEHHVEADRNSGHARASHPEPYEPPTVRTLGTVAELTRGAGTVGIDGALQLVS